MEPRIDLKKKEKSRNYRIRNAEKNQELMTRKSLSVLCAFTDDVLSSQFQLGAEVLYSRTVVLYPYRHRKLDEKTTDHESKFCSRHVASH